MSLRAGRPPREPLLEQVRRLIERSYDHRTATLGSLAPFILGDEGYHRLLAGRQEVRLIETARVAAPGATLADARLLIRATADGRLRVSLYFPDHLIRTLELCDPSRQLNAANIDAFAVFVEELDHLLLLAARARSGPPLTMLEMELHANVTKELVVRHYLARLGRLRRLPPEAVAWVRHHLFEKRHFIDPDPRVRRRYRDATRFAVRYLRHLDRLAPHRRVRSLRRFTRMSHHEKLRAIEGAAEGCSR
jgi:hypothetical protein